MYNATREYEACVLVNGKPVTEVDHNGRTYIEGRKDSEYELRFKNNTSQRILIVPSVDGLNVLDGNPCGVESDGYVINAWQTITIPGWKVDNNTAAKFEFKPQDSYYEEDETYAEQVGEDATNQGVIGFMLFKEKQYPSSWYTTTIFTGSPTTYSGGGSTFRGGAGGGSSLIGNAVCDSSLGGIGGSASNVGGVASNVSNTSGEWTDNSVKVSSDVDPDEGKNLGTGFGESTQFDTVNVSFARETPGNPNVAFAFYYDTIQNLKKMGVPVRAFRKRVKKQRPNPFPVSPKIMPLQGCNPPRNWRK